MITKLSQELNSVLEESLKNNVFSACSVGFFRLEEDSTQRVCLCYGKNEQHREAPVVDRKSVYDLASLTKPLVTALSLLALMKEGGLDLQDRVEKFFPTTKGSLGSIYLEQLLNHSSGLVAHRPFYRQIIHLPEEIRQQRVVEMILAEKLLSRPGSTVVYSDLGYILLGRIIEIVSGEHLQDYWKRVVIDPIGLADGLFFTDKGVSGVGPWVTTGNCPWTDIPLSGVVHDDNCRALGGVAGHAGLFGTITAMITLTEYLLQLYQGHRHHPHLSSSVFRRQIDTRVLGRRFGFDTPTATASSSGRFFSGNSVGHLGFTGTSFWLDLRRGIGIVLLTNRVYCGEDPGAIRLLRPVVHDIIMKYLIQNPGKP